MANLHRYAVRIQQFRDISIDAQNAQHARTLGEADANGVGDADSVQAQGATQTATDVGVDTNGAPLHRYDVTVRFRRNIILDAEDKQSARGYAEIDTNAYSGTRDVQYQTVTFLKENTGVA